MMQWVDSAVNPNFNARRFRRRVGRDYWRGIRMALSSHSGAGGAACPGSGTMSPSRDAADLPKIIRAGRLWRRKEAGAGDCAAILKEGSLSGGASAIRSWLSMCTTASPLSRPGRTLVEEKRSMTPAIITNAAAVLNAVFRRAFGSACTPPRMAGGLLICIVRLSHSWVLSRSYIGYKGRWVNGSMGQWVNWSIGQWVNWSMGQWVNWSIGQLVNGSIGQSVNAGAVHLLIYKLTN